jgi:hypothetical protein
LADALGMALLAECAADHGTIIGQEAETRPQLCAGRLRYC